MQHIRFRPIRRQKVLAREASGHPLAQVGKGDSNQTSRRSETRSPLSVGCSRFARAAPMLAPMKPITVHPVSVLVGAALAGLLLIVTGAAQGAWSARPLVSTQALLVGEIPADWWRFVQLSTTDGTPIETYTVPANHHFVVTSYVGGTNASVLADGQSMDRSLAGVNQSLGRNGNGTRVPIPPGTLLTSSGFTSAIYLWGYLEPVR